MSSQIEDYVVVAMSWQMFNSSFTNNNGVNSHAGWGCTNGLNAEKRLLLNLLAAAVIINSIFIWHSSSKSKKNGIYTFDCLAQQIDSKKNVYLCIFIQFE